MPMRCRACLALVAVLLSACNGPRGHFDVPLAPKVTPKAVEVGGAAVPGAKTENDADALQTLKVAHRPTALALSAAGDAWVVHAGAAELHRLSADGTASLVIPLEAPMTAVTVDATGHVWVGNDQQLQRFTGEGEQILTRSVEAGGPLATDAEGNVWVVQTSLMAGSKLGAGLGRLSTAGNLIGPFSVGDTPIAVAVDAQGGPWVLNFGSSSLMRFGPDGSSLATYAMPQRPRDVAIAADGTVWVCGDGGLIKLSAEGETLGTFNVGVKPRALALEPSGSMWVLSGSDALTRVSAEGIVLESRRTVFQPGDVAVGPDGRVWVADTLRHQVLRLSPKAS